jgi:predicted RecA/RadA family phage recombinase
MKNTVADGQTVTITAGADIESGQGVLTGAIFGVAITDIANGAEGVVAVEGVFTLPKAASQAWAQGVKVYWNNTAKNCTTTATSNTLIGFAYAAVGNGADETLGDVRLVPMAA